LIRASWHRRVVAAAVLAVAVATLGVWWPTLSRHVLGTALFTAVCIVLLIWLVVGIFRVYAPMSARAGAAWSAWADRRKAMREAAAPPEESPPSQEGGQP
jgi:hypothetical protein